MNWNKVVTIATVTGIAAIGTYYASSYFYKQSRNKYSKSLQGLLEEIKASCDTPLQLLHDVADAMTVEMSAGLRTSGGSRLKMLPSYVDKLPTGAETGVYYALDLGGTNFRVLRVSLGGRERRIIQQEYNEVRIPPEYMVGTTEELFDFIAKELASFVAKEGPEYKPVEGHDRELGFTFSFPVEQTAINGGTLIRWTKGFNVAGTVGQDVVQILEAAISRQNLKLKVTALVNDTVGTLAGARYWDEETMVAVILGTGTNACYVEKADSIAKWDKAIPKSNVMVINMEWGNFFWSHLPLTSADRELDAESMNPNEQGFEKLISGMYLGDVVRRLLYKLASEADLFGPDVPEKLSVKDALPTPKMSKMDEDSSEDLHVVGDLLRDVLEIKNTTLQQRKVVHQVCETIGKRGARLAAAGIVGVLKKIGRDGAEAKKISSNSDLHGLQAFKTRVAVDGGLYEHYPKFRKQMHDAVGELLGEHALGLVSIELSKDGSGIGAALLAASHSTYLTED